jgi:hypothetical protein
MKCNPREVIFALRRLGMSGPGAEAALSGMTILNREDRARLAHVTGAILGAEKPPAFWLLTRSASSGTTNNDPNTFDCSELVQWAVHQASAPGVTDLLLPKLTRAGITRGGARQILVGLPVTDSADRKAFAVWLTTR